MTVVDRTSEFFALCQSLPGGNDASKNNPRNDLAHSSGRYDENKHSLSKTDPMSELRNFHSTASNLSQQIYATSALLSELTSLIHSKSHSLFVDESDKVNTLVLRIKIKIENLNKQLDEADLVIKNNKRRLGRNSQAGQEASNLVGQLQEDFVNTTKGFKDVLKVRSELMKTRSDKRGEVFGKKNDGENGQGSGLVLGNKPRVYSSISEECDEKDVAEFNGSSLKNTKLNFGDVDSVKLNLDLTSGLKLQNQGFGIEMPGGESTSQLPRPHAIYGDEGGGGMRNRNSPNVKGIPSYSASVSSFDHTNAAANSNTSLLPGAVHSPFDIQQMEENSGQSQMMQLIPDQNYLRERADAMTQVETNIVELGTIFNKLAVMVNEHQELVERVEDNVDDANENITLSMATLTDTLTNLRTNKALFLKIFSVLVVFIILFITFFA